MDNENLDNVVMALLFASEEPLTVRKIAAILEDTGSSDIRQSIERWQQKINEESWSIVLERVAGGYQLSTRPEYAAYIARLYSGRRKLRLSKAALETMAIIAYKQPITRADIENIRGVGCGGVISNLMERSLVRITGKAKVLGAPFLYGTTQEFLEYLGLNSLKDLPSLEELEALLEREVGAAAETGEQPAAAVGAVPGEGSTDSLDLSDEGAADVLARRESNPEELIPEAADDSAFDTAPDSDVDGPAEEDSLAAARLGPEVDEPYHRPLGDAAGPLRTDEETAAENEEPDDDESRREERIEDRDD
jgi:segregation and condensation protein B